jgi:Lon protease-like protein
LTFNLSEVPVHSLLIPLFPLELVLLPEQPLPLHIFEDRYKQMISECLEAQSCPSAAQHAGEFGVVLAKGAKMHNLGCTARILEVTKRYDDGRVDILTAGRRRFEILSTNQDRSYLRADVGFFDDETEDQATHLAKARAQNLLRQIVEHHDKKAAEFVAEMPLDAPQLSFRIAATLPLDIETKQALLAERSEPDRLENVTVAMEEFIRQFAVTSRVRAKAGGNGHLRALA